jgi:hypothetical protein
LKLKIELNKKFGVRFGVGVALALAWRWRWRGVGVGVGIGVGSFDLLVISIYWGSIYQ